MYCAAPMPRWSVHSTEVLTANRAGIERAAHFLRDGELVAFPTETVYGLGADATNADAVRSVFDAKARPRTDPLIVHVGDLAMAEALGDLGAGHGLARKLAAAFWPGPLTVVVPKRSGPGATAIAGTRTRDRSASRAARGELVDLQLAPEVSMGPTVGLRCPADRVALELIGAAGVPVAAPSANRFGRVSPTSASHVLAELDGRIRAVLDGGPTTLGVESTVVAFDGPVVRVLRPGGVPVEDLSEVLPEGSLRIPQSVTEAPGEPAESPGTSVSHYAPEVPVVFTDRTDALAERIVAALQGRGLDVKLVQLSASDDAARTLYSVLRSLDEPAATAEPPDVAVIAAVDPSGLGRAVNDRLLRAGHGHLYSDAEPSTIEAIIARLEGRFG